MKQGINILTLIKEETINLLSKIAVTKPYFSLKDIKRISADSLLAKIPIEQDPLFEASIISGAEASRHMAILGSLAIAQLLDKDNRNYYLAFEAKFKYCGDYKFDYPKNNNELIGAARVISLCKRDAIVDTKLSIGASPLFNAQIKYFIVPEKIFMRKYATFKQETPACIQNPYKSIYPLNNIRFENDKLYASTGNVMKENCIGHFDNYPAMPVAILMNRFGMAAATLLHKLTGKHYKYIVSKADMAVKELVFAGENVEIEVINIYSKDKVYTFKCTAVNKENVIANLIVTFEIQSEVKAITANYEFIFKEKPSSQIST
jgi:3-hydroxymyristoyl/3-hydroxydecanoyl-(acyl carrier protein) dehydratase